MPIQFKKNKGHDKNNFQKDFNTSTFVPPNICSKRFKQMLGGTIVFTLFFQGENNLNVNSYPISVITLSNIKKVTEKKWVLQNHKHVHKITK